MVVNSHGQHFFGALLPDNVGIKEFFDIPRFLEYQFCGEVVCFGLARFFGYNAVCLFYTPVAYMCIQACNEQVGLRFFTPTERTF